MTRLLCASFERRFPGGPTIEAALQHPLDVFSVTALIGPSGCGKTTVLRSLAGLDVPQTGRIAFGQEVWFDAGRRLSLRPQERGIGYLFQEFALFPHLTVIDNIGFGLARAARREAAHRVGELVTLLKLSGLEARYPHELSGGQQQRVALARTVASRPRLLLLDEPLSALDAPTRAELRRDLRQLLAGWAIPTLIVTHDPTEVVAFADEVVVLSDGRVRQHGPVQEVFGSPVDGDVARIVGRISD
ncbi:MAG TPA: ATP-binding cassette domain-containing protein [Planctomycetaceae bacterium]|nr:ATP-binding cassette domain-containing protein [Planctomycetaceae bacterium]